MSCIVMSGAKTNAALQGKGIPSSSMHFASNTFRYKEIIRLRSDTIGNGNLSSCFNPLTFFMSFNKKMVLIISTTIDHI